MWNDHKSSQRQTRSGRARRWLAVSVLAGALLPALGTAQTSSGTTVTVLKSGLHSIFEGHTLLLTVTEVGSTTSTSTVTIEFLDALDQRRGFASGTLKRARHVQLPVAIPTGAGYQRLRAIVTITPLTNGEASAPSAGLEDLDVDSLTVIPKVFCSIEPIRPGGPEANCEGWHVNRLTLAQANSQD